MTGQYVVVNFPAGEMLHEHHPDDDEFYTPTFNTRDEAEAYANWNRREFDMDDDETTVTTLTQLAIERGDEEYGRLLQHEILRPCDERTWELVRKGWKI